MSRGDYHGNYQRDDEKNKNNGERYHRSSRNNTNTTTNGGGGGYRNNNGGNWHRNNKRGRSPEREAQFPHREVHEREKTTTTSGGGSHDAANVFQDNPFNRSASSSLASSNTAFGGRTVAEETREGTRRDEADIFDEEGTREAGDGAVERETTRGRRRRRWWYGGDSASSRVVVVEICSRDVRAGRGGETVPARQKRAIGKRKTGTVGAVSEAVRRGERRNREDEEDEAESGTGKI